MERTDVIVIGGGQAGLAMSRCLAQRDIDHLVLERGRTGERWHSERWDSLHLLTPGAHSALPGLAQPDPEAFIPASAFAAYLERYAGAIRAPLRHHAEVRALRWTGGEFTAMTGHAAFSARAVVIATGACDVPVRPEMAKALPAPILQLSPPDYRNPAQLPDGGVLIVGASATGIQLAEEIHASGRPVLLSVGEHTRLPRRWRGEDIFVWLHRAGILDDAIDPCGNIDGARRQPSLQLVGRPDRRNLDLGVLAGMGIRLAGRLTDIDGPLLSFRDDLQDTIARADARMQRTLGRIDAYIACRWDGARPAMPAHLPRVSPSPGPLRLSLAAENIKTVIWACGYQRDYRWLHIPVLDRHGEIRQHGGITACPGLFTLGLAFMRRRRSAFIDGCAYDAAEIAADIAAHLGRTRQAA